MLPSKTSLKGHIEAAAVTILIASMMVMPIERLRTASILLAAAVAMALIAGKAFFKQAASLYKPAALLIAGVAASAVFSLHPEKGWVVIRNIILALIMGALFLHLATQRSLLLLRATENAILLILLAAIAAMAAMPSLPGNLLSSNFSQISGLANENSWGLAIAIIANTSLAAALSSDTRPRRTVFFGIYACLIAFMLITNLSRGALLSSLLTSLFLAIFMSARKPSQQRIAIQLTMALAVSASVLMVTAALLLKEDFTYFNDISSYRLSLYKLSWAAIMDTPVWGHGVRTFAIEMGGITQKVIGQKLGTPHNIMLEALYSLGIIGTLLWAIGISFFWRGASTTNNHPETQNVFPRLLGYSIFMQLLFHGIFDLTIFSSYFLSFLFVSGGLLMATNTPNQTPAPQTPQN